VGESWWPFGALFLATELSMLGYLCTSALGAITYNLGHALLGPALLFGWRVLAKSPLPVALGAIWLARVGSDRLAGYGLNVVPVSLKRLPRSVDATGFQLFPLQPATFTIDPNAKSGQTNLRSPSCLSDPPRTRLVPGISSSREVRMKRLSSLVTAVALLSALMSSALASGPAQKTIEDVTGDQIVCEDETYTITSGQIQVVFHEGESASGNFNFTGTITPRKVVAEDSAGNEYRVAGAFWFGGTLNSQTEAFQETFTGKLQIVSAGGGTVDSVNITFHLSPNGVVKEFDFGTCQEPT
jgi:hypothetical protein